ncbi:GDSL-like Lipase/Acylhydrolase family protein [Parapedobacter composti]|uniref:GDSL-like Lipase/Acylhydrolase family protein n=2 Tax=Parapedobacter composti TaxID=623281 RepID=A0A1I1L828_9SPHI|nr:GDSL-like Lipase/Acylhydrolase family protein [Parapedobacter composti]
MGYQRRLLFVCCLWVYGAAFACSYGQPLEPTGILFHQVLNANHRCEELVTEGGVLHYTQQGLHLTKRDQWVKLNRYYALAKRAIRYQVRLAADTKAIFQSDQGDFQAVVDMKGQRIYIGTDPITTEEARFLNPNHDYIVEIHRDYQASTLKVIDLHTGDSARLSATMDGTGGVGRGAKGKGFFVGLQHDYYRFGVAAGSGFVVRQITVFSKQSDLSLLIYGDSITEPEGYFPTADFPQSWTQLVIHAINGKAMSSGRGGTTIQEVLERIKNELPYLKAKYVMVTIGTNGGNTEENLSELVEYILSQGSIPILNNIPANESGTQVAVNAVIEKIRQKYGIKGCRFDLATSVDYDGKEVDKSTMYLEDYDWGQIYHHPNVKGSRLMYLRTLIDVPEIYHSGAE